MYFLCPQRCICILYDLITFKDLLYRLLHELKSLALTPFPFYCWRTLKSKFKLFSLTFNPQKNYCSLSHITGLPVEKKTRAKKFFSIVASSLAIIKKRFSFCFFSYLKKIQIQLFSPNYFFLLITEFSMRDSHKAEIKVFFLLHSHFLLFCLIIFSQFCIFLLLIFYDDGEFCEMRREVWVENVSTSSLRFFRMLERLNELSFQSFITEFSSFVFKQ